jgi:quinohemoprotein ethanol dehydrogenase
MAAETWDGEWWKLGGGGTVWNAMSYDPETDTVLIGTGNGSPWNHQVRSNGKGDNLFLCSIVALDGKTGGYKWHYQINPAETWDYNAAMDIELADLRIDGQLRKVLLTAPKNGFFYVIDRITGKLISAEPFAKQNWAVKIDPASGRPIERPNIRYLNDTTFTIWPGSSGAHGAMPMALDPSKGRAYIPVSNASTTLSSKGITAKNWQRIPGNNFDASVIVEVGDPAARDPFEGTSSLLAWDPVAQRRVWEIPTPGPMNGGLLVTGGRLLFQGQSDGTFAAYSSDTGEKLWSFNMQAPINAGGPISYTAHRHQYVTLITGVGGFTQGSSAAGHVNIDARTMARRVLTFRLDGTAKLPITPVVPIRAFHDPNFRLDPPAAARGSMVYLQHCVNCHGFNAISGGFAPDLRASPVAASSEAFASVVRDGALLNNGMPKFDNLTDAQKEDLRTYLRSAASDFARTE